MPRLYCAGNQSWGFMNVEGALCHPRPGYLLTGKLGHFTLGVVASSNLAVLFVPILAIPGFVWLSS